MDILVVDDDDSLAAMITSGMERWGHHVETSSTGEGALRRLNEKGFDLVLLDVFLPDCKGYELIPRLRGVRPGLMIKPFDLRALKEILDHISNRRDVNEQRVGMGISLTEVV